VGHPLVDVHMESYAADDLVTHEHPQAQPPQVQYEAEEILDIVLQKNRVYFHANVGQLLRNSCVAPSAVPAEVHSSLQSLLRKEVAETLSVFPCSESAKAVALTRLEGCIVDEIASLVRSAFEASFRAGG